MARLEFKHYGNMTAFRVVPAKVYGELLSHFPVACRARGLDLTTLADDEPSREALFKFFTQPGPDIDRDLLRAMHEIDDLSNDVGHAVLVSSAHEAGVVFPPEAQQWDPRRLAIYCWVHERKVFKTGTDLNFIKKSKSFHDFVGKEPRQLALPDQPGCNALAAALKPFFLKRLLGEASDVRAYEDGDTINLVVSHGRPFRSEESLDGVTPSLVAYRPRKHDHIVFDNRTCRLRVSAPDAQTIEEYRAQMGEVFYGDRDWFRPAPIVSLEPLIESGEGALGGFGGVTSAALVEIWLEHGEDRRPTTVIYRARNVFQAAEELDHIKPRLGRPVYAALELRYDSGGRARRVELEPPDKVRFNSAKDRDATIAFLEHAGFVAGPPPDILPPLGGSEAPRDPDAE